MIIPTFSDLSSEQTEINLLPLDGKYLVTGPPGTGKTVMALYRASRYARQEELIRVLMYSNVLSQYVQQAANELEIGGHITTFHKWFWGWHKQVYGKNPEQIEPFVTNWPIIITRILQEPPPKMKTPYLIVDEAQDLPREFFLLAGHLPKSLTVFADDNQAIKEENSSLHEITVNARIENSITLTRNYRNTKEIHDFSSFFFSGGAAGIASAPNKRGRKPIIRKMIDEAAIFTWLSNYVSNNKTKSVGIFLQKRSAISRFFSSLERLVDVPVQKYMRTQGQRPPEVNFRKPGLYLVSHQSAKGLEFDTVIIPDLHRAGYDLANPTDKKLMYVLASRPRSELYFFYNGHQEPSVLSPLPVSLVDRP